MFGGHLYTAKRARLHSKGRFLSISCLAINLTTNQIHPNDFISIKNAMLRYSGGVMTRSSANFAAIQLNTVLLYLIGCEGHVLLYLPVEEWKTMAGWATLYRYPLLWWLRRRLANESAAFSNPSMVFLTNVCWAAAKTVPRAKQLAAIYVQSFKLTHCQRQNVSYVSCYVITLTTAWFISFHSEQVCAKCSVDSNGSRFRMNEFRLRQV